MHDLDRTQLEYGANSGFESANEWDFEIPLDGEYNAGYPFSENEESQLAAELLAVNDEQELDQFFGKLFKRMKRGLGSIAPLLSPLKGLAKTVLPIAGGALGTALVPGLGTALGAGLGTAVSNAFEVQMEGLSPEDQEFELAKKVVRLSGDAARSMSTLSGTLPPSEAARQALQSAAQRHAPGLVLKPANGIPTKRFGQCMPQSGRWVRRGRTIILSA